MKRKFWTITLLLLIGRIGDFYSTSLWFFLPNGMAGETNPLTHFFNIGFGGLILTNLILISLIIIAYYRYCFSHQPDIPKELNLSLSDYASLIYFNKKGVLHQLLYKLPLKKSVFIHHIGFVLTNTLIWASILATIHNLCQFYQLPAYDTFRDIVKRPLFVIYGLIFISFVYYSYKVLKQDYQVYLKTNSKYES